MDEAKNLSYVKGEGSPSTPSQVEAIFSAALIAMTTKSSMSVKPQRRFGIAALTRFQEFAESSRSLSSA